jgi:hypothetical protein
VVSRKFPDLEALRMDLARERRRIARLIGKFERHEMTLVDFTSKVREAAVAIIATIGGPHS